MDSRNSLVPLREGGLPEKFSNGLIEKTADTVVLSRVRREAQETEWLEAGY
jgi:hypothetical protein